MVKNIRHLFGDKMLIQTASGALKELWEIGFFSEERTFIEIKARLRELGLNPTDDSLQKGLLRAKYLTRRGIRRGVRYIQKCAANRMVFAKDVLPKELIVVLGSDFKTEMDDLRLNYGRSGTCTAFLLRKTLEKLIFITFTKNGFEDELREKNRDLVGLKTMLNLCETLKVRGMPFLMPKTAKSIDGIKFLGDTSAHNPLVIVSMDSIIPMMPYIITAYSELSRKL